MHCTQANQAPRLVCKPAGVSLPCRGCSGSQQVFIPSPYSCCCCYAVALIPLPKLALPLLQMERLQGEAAQLREAAAAHSGAEDEDAAQVIAVLRQQVEEAKAAEAKVRCRGPFSRWSLACSDRMRCLHEHASLVIPVFFKHCPAALLPACCRRGRTRRRCGRATRACSRPPAARSRPSPSEPSSLPRADCPNSSGRGAHALRPKRSSACTGTGASWANCSHPWRPPPPASCLPAGSATRRVRWPALASRARRRRCHRWPPPPACPPRPSPRGTQTRHQPSREVAACAVCPLLCCRCPLLIPLHSYCKFTGCAAAGPAQRWRSVRETSKLLGGEAQTHTHAHTGEQRALLG